MKRRKFIVGAGAAAAAAGIVHAPAVIAQQKYRWRMPTTWTPALDVMQGSAQRLAQMVAEMSGGRLTIEVFPAGQIVPPLGVFDACSQGTVEAFMGASYYWAGKDPAVQWFTSVPFGMNPGGMASW
ncbi:MAG: ABC transporter substrate-binding protein, partial [Burkholderiales bacterium]